MRHSKREEILQAAARVVQSEGVTALTYESVAAEAGLTKGGLLYHFPSREEMLQALHVYVAGRWEQAMVSEADAPADQLDPETRFEAFVRASQYPGRAELLLMLEASENPVSNAVWHEVYQRWVVEAPADPDADDAALDHFIARLAADGLWLAQSLAADKLDPQLRMRLAERITRLGQAASRRR